MQIANPKREVSKGIELNDKDYLNAILSILKDMEKNYCLMMSEASNEYLYNKIRNIFNECAERQREVFELMFTNGWYKLESVDKMKIDSKLQMLNEELSSL